MFPRKHRVLTKIYYFVSIILSMQRVTLEMNLCDVERILYLEVIKK